MAGASKKVHWRYHKQTRWKTYATHTELTNPGWGRQEKHSIYRMMVGWHTSNGQLHTWKVCWHCLHSFYHAGQVLSQPCQERTTLRWWYRSLVTERVMPRVNHLRCEKAGLLQHQPSNLLSITTGTIYGAKEETDPKWPEPKSRERRQLYLSLWMQMMPEENWQEDLQQELWHS